MTPNLVLGVCFHWLGGLTFGLTMRYLDMSLGTGVALGYCAAFGTLVPRAANYFFSALAETTWYVQFFFYTMGETQMGRFGFSSWALHMASMFILSTMWGWILHEWKGSSRRTHALIAAGIATLIFSTLVVGYGNYLKVVVGK